MLTWWQFFDSPTDAVLVRSRRETVELFAGLGAEVEDRKQWMRLRSCVPELQNVPLSQLRSKLAEATSCAWESLIARKRSDGSKNCRQRASFAKRSKRHPSVTRRSILSCKCRY